MRKSVIVSFWHPVTCWHVFLTSLLKIFCGKFLWKAVPETFRRFSQIFPIFFSENLGYLLNACAILLTRSKKIRFFLWKTLISDNTSSRNFRKKWNFSLVLIGLFGSNFVFRIEMLLSLVSLYSSLLRIARPFHFLACGKNGLYNRIECIPCMNKSIFF